MTELAQRYSIHRRTVSAILKRHGVPTRASGLTPEQIQRAVLMYAQGQSLTKIGKLLGADATTVHTRLREQGVKMRDTRTTALIRDVYRSAVSCRLPSVANLSTTKKALPRSLSVSSRRK